jgi:hypothetical protein
VVDLGGSASGMWRLGGGAEAFLFGLLFLVGSLVGWSFREAVG